MSDPAVVGDGEFARELFRRAVTEQRVTDALASLDGRGLSFGPYTAAGLAGIAVSGTLGAGRVRSSDPDVPSFAVTVPATLDISVRLGVESRLRADVEIDLLLSPRGADPLQIVVDVAPVRAQDVRVTVRGRGLGAAVDTLLTGLADELGGRIAAQVSALLDTDGPRRARTIDVAARIDGRRGDPGTTTRWIDDHEFGRRFVRHAVTAARIHDAVAHAAERPIELDLRAGPGRAAAVHVSGTVHDPVVNGADAHFTIALSMTLDVVVELARGNHFHADVRLTLDAVARPSAGLHLVVDIAALEPADVDVTLASDGTRAALLARLGRLDRQVREQVARTVNRRVAEATGRVVDVGARIDRSADRSGPSARRRPRPGGGTRHPD